MNNLKNAISLIVLLTFFALVSSCEKLGTIYVNRDISVSFNLDSANANDSFTINFLVPIKQIKQSIAEKSSNINIAKINLNGISLVLSDSFTVDFEDFENATILKDNETLGSLPKGASGDTVVFELPSTVSSENYINYYNEEKDLPLILRGKTKNDISISKLWVILSFYIEGELLFQQ